MDLQSYKITSDLHISKQTLLPQKFSTKQH